MGEAEVEAKVKAKVKIEFKTVRQMGIIDVIL